MTRYVCGQCNELIATDDEGPDETIESMCNQCLEADFDTNIVIYRACKNQRLRDARKNL